MQPPVLPKIISVSEKKLIGKRVVTTLGENKTVELWRSFMPRRKEIINALNTELISMAIYDPLLNFLSFNQDTSFEKWAALEVTDFDFVPDGMETFTIPAGLYASFLYQGDARFSAGFFRYIFGTWLPHSVYDVDHRPHFEVLGAGYKRDDDSSEEDIYVPIKLK
jgi:AraC family transcriptional regulator